MNRAPASQTPHRIALLFNANKVYDREIIAGIGHYLRSTRVAWDLFLEEDFRCRLAGIERFDGDGIIADFDDPAVADANIVRRRIDNAKINTALSNSFGFGGTNASLVFQRYNG